MALSKLHLCVKVWEAWTDFGSLGVVRRAGLGKSDKFSEAFSHPPLDPLDYLPPYDSPIEATTSF